MIAVMKKVHFERKANGRKRLTDGPVPVVPPRTPRISKLMALAIRFQELLRDGTVVDQSDLARLAHVTQPRMTQIMNLLHLAPDIQEELLQMPQIKGGHDPLTERDLRFITRVRDWRKQRLLWRAVHNGEAPE